jgi:hypothetical protein
MPFVVTTKRVRVWVDMPTGEDDDGERSATTIERRAVATLEEAREAAHVQVVARTLERLAWPDKPPWFGYVQDADALPESGGAVGPLPDGTTIHVEATTKQALFDALPMDDQRRLPTWPLPTLAMVIAAFNAAQAGQ